MSDMHLIMENWSAYVAEAEIGGTAPAAATTTGDGAPDTTEEPTAEQIKLVQDFIKSIAVLADASNDAGEEQEEELAQQLHEVPGSKSRRRKKRLKRQRQEYVQKIKERAGVAGIKMKDFTPEQRKLYDEAKELFKQEAEQSEFEAMNTIANGDLLDVPLIKKIVDKGGTPLKAALTLVAGECASNLTLTCLTNQLAAQGTGTGF